MSTSTHNKPLAFEASNTEVAGASNNPMEPNTFIGESRMEEQPSGARLTVNRTPLHAQSRVQPRWQIHFNAVAVETDAEGSSASTPGIVTISRAEGRNFIFQFFSCPERYIVAPGAFEEEPPQTRPAIYSANWRPRIPKGRSVKGFMRPTKPRLTKGQQRRRKAYRARMVYLECMVDVAHRLGFLTVARNFEEELWPELKRLYLEKSRK